MSAIKVSRLGPCLALALLALDLAGCQTLLEGQATPPVDNIALAATDPELTEQKYFPSNEPLRLGLLHFSRGNHGLAERYFRDAVEKSPRNASAWIGLAASYDHIKRFDLADRAYRTAIQISGETTQILNNQGYSYMLRGNWKMARAKFQKAYRRDPHNLTIINNLEILNSRLQSDPRSS